MSEDHQTGKSLEIGRQVDLRASGAGKLAEDWPEETDAPPPPPSFELYCDAINGSNDALANVNDRLEQILSRTRGSRPNDEKTQVLRDISSAGYDDTLGQLCGVYDAQVKRYFCLVDELERFL